MGYFKQLEIANQVEVGDRIPAPKSATTHAAYPTRKLYREIEKATRDNDRRLCLAKILIAFSVVVTIVNVMAIFSILSIRGLI